MNQVKCFVQIQIIKIKQRIMSLQTILLRNYNSAIWIKKVQIYVFKPGLYSGFNFTANEYIRHPVTRSCYWGATCTLPFLLLLILLQTRTQDRLKRIFHACPHVVFSAHECGQVTRKQNKIKVLRVDIVTAAKCAF